MATRSRIGYVLPDDSILSVYHHWDGYPEWLGVTLEAHYNTDEKVAELIDGGNMSSCYSDNDWDGEKCDPRPVYYTERGESLDDNAPRLAKNLDEMAQLSTDAEYLYLFLKGEWHAYSTDIKFDDDWNITGIITKPVKIPKESRTV